MRIDFTSIDQPKRLARAISRETQKALTACHRAIAIAAGYRDWHDLETVLHRATLQHANSVSVEREVDFAIGIASSLETAAVAISRAIAATGLFAAVDGLDRSRVVIPAVFRRSTIPDLGKRQPGAVGKFKYDQRPIILRRYGQPTSVLFHRASSGAVGDFEYISPRQEIALFVPASLYLAYGAWHLSDGSLVLHSRDYLPLWHIEKGRRPKPANPSDWINHVSDEHFWDDRNAPWDSKSRLLEEHLRLVDYGVIGMPPLVDILPELIYSQSHPGIRGAAKKRFGATSNLTHRELENF